MEAMTYAAVNGLVCGWQPPLTPSPEGGLIHKQHPQAPLSSYVCPRKAKSFADRSLASYAAAAPLILPPTASSAANIP